MIHRLIIIIPAASIEGLGSPVRVTCCFPSSKGRVRHLPQRAKQAIEHDAVSYGSVVHERHWPARQQAFSPLLQIKLCNFPRTNVNGSISSQQSNQINLIDLNQHIIMAESTQPPPAENKDNTTSARRRSSGWMPAFEGLQQHHGSQTNVTRRESMSDQQPKGGIFSQLFHNNFGRNAK